MFVIEETIASYYNNELHSEHIEKYYLSDTTEENAIERARDNFKIAKKCFTDDKQLNGHYQILIQVYEQDDINSIKRCQVKTYWKA